MWRLSRMCGFRVQPQREPYNTVLKTLEEASFFLKPSKCQFEQTKIKYLGVVLNREKIQMDPVKIKGVSKWPRELTSVKDIHTTMGILGYQRPFIRGFAEIARPITSLLKKGVNFVWGPE